METDDEAFCKAANEQFAAANRIVAHRVGLAGRAFRIVPDDDHREGMLTLPTRYYPGEDDASWYRHVDAWHVHPKALSPLPDVMPVDSDPLPANFDSVFWDAVNTLAELIADKGLVSFFIKRRWSLACRPNPGLRYQAGETRGCRWTGLTMAGHARWWEKLPDAK